jgi:predicted ATPase
MLKTLAVANYRSINTLIVPLERLNVITGPNGSGKSNLYRALRLLAETAQGGVINALAREGGLDSTFWAGPEKLSRRMLSGEVEVQGGPVMKSDACGWASPVRISATPFRWACQIKPLAPSLWIRR